MYKKRIKAVFLVSLMCFYYFFNCEVSVRAFEGKVVTGFELEKEEIPVVEQSRGIPENQNLNHTKEDDRYIVIAKNGKKIKDINNKYEKVNIAGKTSENDIYDNNMTVVSMTGNEAIALQKEDNILRVEKDVTVKGSRKEITNREVIKRSVKKSEAEWNLQTIKADKLEKADNISEKKVKVAVIDSGVDYANDINVAKWVDYVPGEEELLPLFSDVSGHGTSVAGIIGALDDGEGITGVLPGVEIYSARVLDNENSAPVSRVIEGIYWAIEQDVNIINMSFGTKINSEALHKAIQDAYNAGILIVAAAGNTGEKVEYPAAYDEVIAVGSVDSEGIIADDSAKAGNIELVAPGEKVKSTGGFGGNIICSGTSMAAPHVSGVAALLWQKDLSMPAEFIREVLNKSANAYGIEDAYGNGLIDVEYALKYYSKWKKEFSKKGTLGVEKNTYTPEISTNETPVISFEDTGYVEGRWAGSDHDSMVESNALTATELSIMKYGAVYPDLAVDTKGLSAHPYWHGGYKSNNDYISNYIYITHVARSIMYGVDIENSVQPNDLNWASAAGIRASVGYIEWNEFMNNITNRKKGLFVWGMAIHALTDTYAHCCYGYVYSKKENCYKWEHLDHDARYNNDPHNEAADNVDILGGRYLTAQMAARSSISRCLNDLPGCELEYGHIEISNNLADNNWKIINLSYYMGKFNPTVAAYPTIIQFSHRVK